MAQHNTTHTHSTWKPKETKQKPHKLNANAPSFDPSNMVPSPPTTPPTGVIEKPVSKALKIEKPPVVDDDNKDGDDDNKKVEDDKKEVADDKKEVAEDKKEVADDTKEVVDDTKEVAEDKEEVADDTKEVADDNEEIKGSDDSTTTEENSK